MPIETAYDHVFHAQRHFRSILEAVSRPGTIVRLDDVPCRPPAGLSRASALIGFALLNADVSFHLVGYSTADAAYLVENTRSRECPIEDASFIFARGTEHGDILEGASVGTLPYPDTSATLILQVDALSAGAVPGGLAVRLEGPGQAAPVTIHAAGVSPDLLLALQARNLEFPLGLDTIVTHTDQATGTACVVGIPRTTRLSWDVC